MNNFDDNTVFDMDEEEARTEDMGAVGAEDDDEEEDIDMGDEY